MSEDKPSNPPPAKTEKLMAALSEHSSDKSTAHAREELSRHLETTTPPSDARDEVTEAATKFVDGVDVLTETLLLILGKFKTIIWRTTVGMIFGGVVLITCLLVARQTQQTALAQEVNARKVAELTTKFEEALRRLEKIQQSADKTEQKVDAVKQTTDAKPSIEIVPSKDKPGEAKVVIRPTPSSSAAPQKSPPLEIQFALPKRSE